MVEDSQVLIGILAISGGIATLCIAVISIAYQVLLYSEDEDMRARMTSTVTLGGIAGIMLLVCVLLSSGALVFHVIVGIYFLYMIFVVFSVAIFIMMYILLLLLGYQIQRGPLPKSIHSAKKQEETDNPIG